MPIQLHRPAAHVTVAISLSAILAPLLQGCQSDTTDPPPVTTGTLRVLIRTSGATLDEDGYSYQVGSSTVTLAVQDSQEISDLPAGPIAVELGGVADNCSPFTRGPESVSIVAQQVATVSLVVVCDSALRNIVLFEHWPNATTPELRLMRPDGSGKELFLPGARSPAATPDGTEIIYTDWATSQLWSIRSEKTQRRRLLPDLGGGQGMADVSPDGGAVVFERWTAGLTEIYRAGLNGGDTRQLTAGYQDFEPRWSPDGSTVVFSRLGSDNVLQVYRVSAEGGDTVRLTDDGGCCARWSPDGQRLLFLGATGLQTMAPDGSDAAPVEGIGIDGATEWSPDGSELLAEAIIDDRMEIWRIPLGGFPPTTIAADPIYNRLGRWLR